MTVQSTLENTGLKTSDIEKIHQVLHLYPQVKKAILYGSRAKGNFKPFSDIDLTLVGTELDLTLQQKIETELEDLLLPYTFDISILDNIQNTELKEHIKRAGVDFFTV